MSHGRYETGHRGGPGLIPGGPGFRGSVEGGGEVRPGAPRPCCPRAWSRDRETLPRPGLAPLGLLVQRGNRFPPQPVPSAGELLMGATTGLSFPGLTRAWRVAGCSDSHLDVPLNQRIPGRVR